MTDRLDDRIRGFVVELVDDVPEPPPFPTVSAEPAVTLAGRRRRGPIVVFATFLFTLAIGIPILTWWQVDDDAFLELPEPSVQELVDMVVEGVNSGDLEATLEGFAPDAICLLPQGQTSCAESFGFFIAAGGVVSLEDCQQRTGQYYRCFGYLHTIIHTALGLSADDMASSGNMNPSVLVEEGKITRFNINEPFTGDLVLDKRLWSYLLDTGADFVTDEGIPWFTPDIVDDFREAAAAFAASEE